jgi:hypothetical protein
MDADLAYKVRHGTNDLRLMVNYTTAVLAWLTHPFSVADKRHYRRKLKWALREELAAAQWLAKLELTAIQTSREGTC